MNPLIPSPPTDVKIESFSPARQTLGRGQATGLATLTLHNESERPLALLLTGSDEDTGCYFEFSLPDGMSLAKQTYLPLEAGETVTIPIHISPPARSWLGLGKTGYPFTITVQLLAAPYTSRSLLGHIATQPIIGPALASLLLVGVLTFSFYLYSVLPPAEVVQKVVALSGQEPELEADPLRQSITQETLLSNEAVELETIEVTYEAMFQDVAAEYDLDWRLLARQAYRESRLDPWALGRDHDMGLMQIIPSTWDEWAPKAGVTVTDPFDPYNNVRVGAAYLAFLRDHFSAQGYPELHWTVLAYNWGPRNVQELLENEGTWADVPARQRQYTLEILQGVADPSFTWQEVQVGLLEKVEMPIR